MSRLVLAVALIAGAFAISCAFTQLDDVSCPDGGTPLTYDNFGRMFFATWCNRCHSATLQYRHGAPEQFVFDSPEEIRKHRSRIFERAAADNDSMPPGPTGPPQKERDQLAVWLACGAP